MFNAMLGVRKYVGPTIDKEMNEPVKSGRKYTLSVRYDAVHSAYPTAWIYNEENNCIAVIPYKPEEWKEDYNEFERT